MTYLKKYKTPAINYKKAPVRRETEREKEARRGDQTPFTKKVPFRAKPKPTWQ